MMYGQISKDNYRLNNKRIPKILFLLHTFNCPVIYLILSQQTPTTIKSKDIKYHIFSKYLQNKLPKPNIQN